MISRPEDLRSVPAIYISRPRLLRKLAQATRGRLTIVCANAGYGKTSLANEFIRSSDLRAEWFHLTAIERDISRFADGLDRCLRQLGSGADSALTRRSRRRQNEASSVRALLQALLKQASRLGPEPTLLVLNDYHHVDQSPDVNSLLELFIEECPANLHFLLLSRSAPRFRLGKLMARQEVSTLGEDELAFTREETFQFLRCGGGLDLEDAAVALVHDRTEGWAAGIAMVSQSLRYGRRDRVMSVLADPVGSAWLVYDYLAEEVFDREEPSTQQFLTQTSILSQMTAEACDHLLGSDSSQSTLQYLAHRGLFTSSIDPARQTFRYHQLFREFLRQKLHQREARETVGALHLKAARFYEQKESWEESIHHYLKAGEPLPAARIVESAGERYIFSGFSQTVDYWLRVLPEDLADTRPWLLALRGRLSHMSVRLEDALRLLERALWLFKAEGNPEGQAWVGGDIGYVKYRLRHLLQAIRHYEAALPMARPGTMLRSRLLANQAQAYREAGMLEESVKACQAAMEEAAGVEDEASRTWCYSRAVRVLAHAQMEMGQIEAARRGLEEVLRFCVAHQIGEYEESWVLADQGIVLWAGGDFDRAISALQRSLSLSGRYVPHLRHFIGLWLGNSLRDSGRYAEAEKAYAESSQVAELEAVYMALISGRGRAARSAIADLYRRYRISEGIAERTTAEVVYAAILHDSGEQERALEHIHEAVRLLSGHGYQLRLASALLHQARLEFDLSRPAEGREALARAFELGAANGYYHFFWWDPELVAFLCERAVGEGIFADYASELAMRRLDSRWAGVFTSLVHHRNPEVRRLAESILSSFHQTGSAADPFLSDCPDPAVRRSVLRAVREGVISAEGVHTLRSRHGLSWREVEIVVEYYLRAALQPLASSARMREECARRLTISQNTVRCHVNNIRGKLGLPKTLSGKQVLEWARDARIIRPEVADRPSMDRLPDALEASRPQ